MEINLKTKKTLKNTNKLSNGRNDAIKFVDDCISMILKTKRKVSEEKHEPEPSKAKNECKKSPLELCEEFINEI